MIWIECDCCEKTLAKHEPYSEITIKSLGPGIVPLTRTMQKLVNCLRNDFGLVAEWDGLRKFWTIEVDHED